MKNYTSLLVLTILLSSCTSMKNPDSITGLYDSRWELEYISGPRIAFEGLFPEKKPQLTFSKETSEVSGSSSCNGYGTRYTLEGKSILFGEPNPTTMMFCDGGGEQFFLQMIKKISSYSIDKDNKLNLNIGQVPMMRFKKVTK